MKKILAIILAAAMFTGCATNTGANYRPVIDGKPGDTVEQQQKDLAECQAHANKVASGSERAAAGAVAGAVLGAIFAAALGVKQYTPEIAQATALTGAMEGATRGESDQRTIVTKCMAGRGHRVLM